MARGNSKNKSKKISLFRGGKMDYTLVVITILLLCIGLITLLSASAPTSIAENGNGYSYALKQGVLALIGIVGMFLLSIVDYRWFK